MNARQRKKALWWERPRAKNTRRDRRSIERLVRQEFKPASGGYPHAPVSR
jgi:hypothetical protein